MNLETLLLFGGVIFVLGVLAGYLVARFSREERSNQSSESTAEQAIKPATQPPIPDAVELVRLWKDPQSGKVIFQAPEGHVIDASAAKKTLQQAFSQPVTIEKPPAVAEEPKPAPGMPAEQTRSFPIPESQQKVPSEVKPVNMNPFETLSRTFQKPKVASPRSIAGQIDDILQERIAGSELARRGLRLLDLPDHGLGVVLDLHTYQGIEAVPDQSIQQTIREAVAEWQNRNK